MADGNIDVAIRLSRQYNSRNPRDPAGFVALGDALFRRMPAGRFEALRAYETAQRLAPSDPMTPYRMAEVGLFLGGDDGESIARRGLERVLSIDPTYADAWDLWLTLFRGGGYRRQMIDRLRRGAAPNAYIAPRVATLLIEEERYSEADSVLDAALASAPRDPGLNALRAQSALETEDVPAGLRHYRTALANASEDSAQVLWKQVVGIAASDEILAWRSVPPDQRGRWLETFWARRHPNLFAGINERIVEHFARLRYARSHYALLHPLVSYHRTQLARALSLEPSRGEREFHQRCEAVEIQLPPNLQTPRDPRTGRPLRRAALAQMSDEQIAQALGLQPGISRATDRARTALSPLALLTDAERARGEYLTGLPIPRALLAPLNMDLRSVDSVAARIGYNLAMGLDDRGVMYLRFGAPEGMLLGGSNNADPQCNSMDIERWRYSELGEVRFARPSAFSGGERVVPDMVFRSMNQEQFDVMRSGLTRDASSQPAPLPFGVWTAQFADTSNVDRATLVVVATRGALAASVIGVLSGADEVRTGGQGIVGISRPPGRYVMLAQVNDSGQLGRQTLRVHIRSVAGRAGLSDLLLAEAWDTPPVGRADVLQHVSRTLTFTAGQPIRSYAEVYGLVASDERWRFVVRYSILRTDDQWRDIAREDWPNPAQIAFVREVMASGRFAPEVLDITPDQIPAGRYLLRLIVEDLVAQRSLGSRTIAFTVR